MKRKLTCTTINEKPSLSDQYLIITNFHLGLIPKSSIPSEFYRSYNNADWHGFHDALNKEAIKLQNELDSMVTNENNINNLTDKIFDSVINSFNNNCPLVKPGG